jgi:hypothetical protein
MKNMTMRVVENKLVIEVDLTQDRRAVQIRQDGPDRHHRRQRRLPRAATTSRSA